MKKIIICASILGLFVLTANNVAAQTSQTVTKEIDTKTAVAIKTINANKKLTDTEKKNYVTRISIAARVAKTKNDTEGKASYDNDFNTLEASYSKKTGEQLTSSK